MHGRPRLNAFGRQLIVERLASGRSAAVVAEELGVSRATVYTWKRRYEIEGEAGLVDRPCRPLSSPRRLSPDAEAAILLLRQSEKLGPHRLAARLGLPRSTCYKVLRRHGLHRLDWLDRPTGRLIRRYEWEQPGDLVHVDVKKLGRIPAGGGHRGYGRRLRRPTGKRGQGYEFVHSLVDDHSRLAYSEVLDDEQGPTCAAFLRRAAAFMRRLGAGGCSSALTNASRSRPVRVQTSCCSIARTAASSALETMKSEIEVPLRLAAYSMRRFCSGLSRASTRSIFLNCLCGVFSTRAIVSSQL